jgi:hypothetical protein
MTLLLSGTLQRMRARWFVGFSQKDTVISDTSFMALCRVSLATDPKRCEIFDLHFENLLEAVFLDLMFNVRLRIPTAP